MIIESEVDEHNSEMHTHFAESFGEASPADRARVRLLKNRRHAHHRLAALSAPHRVVQSYQSWYITVVPPVAKGRPVRIQDTGGSSSLCGAGSQPVVGCGGREICS